MDVIRWISKNRLGKIDTIDVIFITLTTWNTSNQRKNEINQSNWLKKPVSCPKWKLFDLLDHTQESISIHFRKSWLWSKLSCLWNIFWKIWFKKLPFDIILLVYYNLRDFAGRLLIKSDKHVIKNKIWLINY